MTPKSNHSEPQKADNKHVGDLSDDYAEFYKVCEECHHSMSIHVGVVDMGGGHSEPIGCTHNTKDGMICECLNYEKGWDE